MQTARFYALWALVGLMAGCALAVADRDVPTAEAPVTMASLAHEDPPPQERADCPRLVSELPTEFAGDARTRAERLIVVFKHAEMVGAYENGVLVTSPEPMCYPITMGVWPYEAKTQTDHASTPEGWYEVARKRSRNPDDAYPPTIFELSLHVNYPNEADVDRALALAVIDPATAGELMRDIAQRSLPRQNSPMGGAILLHSWYTSYLDDDLGEDVRVRGTTAGCVGIDDENMSSLFTWSERRDPILMLPWRLVLMDDGTTAEASVPRDATRMNFTADDLSLLIDPVATAKAPPGRVILRETQVVGRTGR